MSISPLDRDDEVEQLIRQLVIYTLKNRRGRVPVAFGFRVIYAPTDSVLESPTEEDFIETEPEVTTIDGKVVVVTELPGVNAENIRMALSGRTLQIVADQEHRHFRSEARLPELHLIPMRTSFKHGILEIMFESKHDDERAQGSLAD